LSGLLFCHIVISSKLSGINPKITLIQWDDAKSGSGFVFFDAHAILSGIRRS